LETAKKELAALESRVPSITARVEGPAMPVAKLDGHALAASELGARKQVDPGTHVLEASANGWSSQDNSVAVNEGASNEIVLTRSHTPEAGAPPPAATSHSEGSGEQGSPKHPLPLKPIGFVAGALGIVGLGVGGVTGGLAMREHSILVDKCPKNRCLPAQ